MQTIILMRRVALQALSSVLLRSGRFGRRRRLPVLVALAEGVALAVAAADVVERHVEVVLQDGLPQENAG